MGHVDMHPAKVVRVTAQEFELDAVPTPQEFQRIYDMVAERLQADDWLGLDQESR